MEQTEKEKEGRMRRKKMSRKENINGEAHGRSPLLDDLLIATLICVQVDGAGSGAPSQRPFGRSSRPVLEAPGGEGMVPLSSLSLSFSNL